MPERDPKSDPGPQFQVRWSTIGVAGLILGVGSLGALAVVATIKDADVLSTVALALAVLAFVIQILMFIAQGASAAQQNTSMLAINAETKTLLGELRTRTLATNEVINQQYNKLLDRVLQSTAETVSEAATESDVPAPELRKQFLEDLRVAVEEARKELSKSDDTVGQVEASRIERPPNSRYGTWPPSTVEFRLRDRGLDELSEPAARLLRRFADKVQQTGADNFRMIVRDGADGIEELTEKGIITNRGRLRDDVAYGLTSKGASAIRLILAPFPARQGVLDRFPWLAYVRDDVVVTDDGSVP